MILLAEAGAAIRSVLLETSVRVAIEVCSNIFAMYNTRSKGYILAQITLSGICSFVKQTIFDFSSV